VSVQDVLSEHGIEEIAAGGLDLAVIASWGAFPEAPAHVTLHPLLLDPMVVVLPDDHPLAAQTPRDAPLRLEDLRDESWVTILAGHAAREQFDQAAAGAGFTPRIRFQTASYDVAQALVGTGIGVALVSRLALTGVPGTTHRELARPRLHRLLHAVTATETTLTPLVEVFLTLLRDVAEDLTATWTHPAAD
jgi:DNA-binding transcriptional LysR family regulator